MKKEDFKGYIENTKKILNFLNPNKQKDFKVSESDTKNKIIYPLLNLLGYNEIFIRREMKEGISKLESDVLIDIPSSVFYSNNEKIVIEAKNLNIKLGAKQARELINKYMLDKSPNWGILTNGKEYRLYGKPLVNYDNKVELYKVFIDFENIDINNNEIIDELYNGIMFFSKKYIVDSINTSAFNALAKFLGYMKEKYNGTNKNPNNTLRVYKDEIECFINYMSNNHPGLQFKQINQYFIEQFTEYRCLLKKNKGYINRPSRLETILEYILSFLKYCYHYKLVGYNYADIKYISALELSQRVFAKLRGEKNIESKKQAIPLKADELRKVIQYLRKEINNKKNMDIEKYYISYRNFICFILGIYIGCKKSELRNLKWSEVDLGENVITIKDKVITLNNYILDELKKFSEIHKIYCKEFSKKVNIRDEFLFLNSYRYHNNEDMRVVSSDHFDYILKNSLVKMGINKSISAESLRITAIGLIFENIKSITLITEYLGKNLNNKEIERIYKELGYNTKEISNNIIKQHPINQFLKMKD